MACVFRRARSSPADRRYRRRAGRRSTRSRKSRPHVAPPNPPCPRQWRRTARSAPDFPPGMCAEKLALRLAPGIMMPRQFGPIRRIPYFCAARSAASASDPDHGQAGTDNDRALCTAAARLVDQAGDRFAGAVNTTSSGTNGNLDEAADRLDAVDLGIARIHQAEFAREFRLADIVENGPADRASAGWRRSARPNGGQQIFQAIGRHRSGYPAGAGPL